MAAVIGQYGEIRARRRGPSRGTAGWNVSVTGVNELRRAMRAIAEQDAPFIRNALMNAAHLAAAEVNSRAPGGMAGKAQFRRLTRKGTSTRAIVSVQHRGAKSMEFGRRYYYVGYSGRRMKATGRKVLMSPGQPARPFVGIIRGDHAIGAVRPRIVALLRGAIRAEWERLGRTA